jgi:putative membrane protein
MRLLIRFIVNMAAVVIAAYLLEGVSIDGFTTLVLATLALAIINTVLKPVLHVLAFPINALTLGLFSLIINGFLILLVEYLVPGFTVASFWWAIGFSLVLSIVSGLLHLLTPGD